MAKNNNAVKTTSSTPHLSQGCSKVDKRDRADDQESL